MTPKTLAELAALVGAELRGPGEATVDGMASLRDAGPRELSFLTDARYADDLRTTAAGAVVVRPAQAELAGDLPALLVEDPSAAVDLLAAALAPPTAGVPEGIHPSAVVDPSAEVGAGAAVGPLVSVGPGASLGAGCVLHAGVVVGEGASVGAGSVLHPRVVLYPHVRIGARCVLHAGVVLGSGGFGFAPTPEGWVPIPQSGSVVLGDDVEMGANCAVDCARLGVTRVGNGVKLDNLVHIAHNVQIGDHSLIVAQSGVAGSARLGRGVVLAGQVGINGHLTLGDGVRVGGKSAVFKDVPAGREVLGIPATDKRAAIRNMRTLPRLHELERRVRQLEARLAREGDST
jgi:UDP-3-O-[3-hydroxymyristoyl] glucosamine N-acyltransferase